jgi:hypothetical protein
VKHARPPANSHSSSRLSRVGAAAGPLRGLRGGARGGAEVPATRGPIWRSVRCAATARDPTPPRRSPSWHGPRHCGRRYRSASHRSLSASPDRPADRLGATSCTVIPAVYASSTRRVHARVRGGAGGDLVLLGAPFPPCSISRLASHPSASRVGLRVRAWAYGPDSTRLHLAAARQAGSGASSRPRDWCRAHLSLIILTAMHAVVSLRIFACVLDCVASVAGAADGLRPGEVWCQPSAVRLQPAASLRVAFGQGLFSLLREGGGAERDDRKRADSDQRRGWGEARDR